MTQWPTTNLVPVTVPVTIPQQLQPVRQIICILLLNCRSSLFVRLLSRRREEAKKRGRKKRGRSFVCPHPRAPRDEIDLRSYVCLCQCIHKSHRLLHFFFTLHHVTHDDYHASSSSLSLSTYLSIFHQMTIVQRVSCWPFLRNSYLFVAPAC